MHRCKFCGSTSFASTPEGTVCTGCAIMTDDINIDFGPEWRSMEDGPDMRRVGAPNDTSLGTVIGDNGGLLSRANRRTTSDVFVHSGLDLAVNTLQQLVHLSEEMEQKIRDTVTAAKGKHKGARWWMAAVVAAYQAHCGGGATSSVDLVAALKIGRYEMNVAREAVRAVTSGPSSGGPRESDLEIAMMKGLKKLQGALGTSLPEVKRIAKALLERGSKTEALAKYDKLTSLVAGVAYTAYLTLIRGEKQTVKTKEFASAFNTTTVTINKIRNDILSAF